MTLETIFKLWGGQKERGRPGRNKICRICLFPEEEYIRAVQFIRDFKGKLTGRNSTKVLFLYNEAGRNFLELAEVSTADPDAPTRGRSTRDRVLS